MAKTYASPNRAPEYRLHREVTAVDAAAATNKMEGMLMQDSQYANIQVVPDNGANPDIEVLFWSQEAGKFISAHNPVAFSGAGVDTPFEVTVEVNGRRIWVMVPVMAAGDCKILVCGFEPDQK